MRNLLSLGLVGLCSGLLRLPCSAQRAASPIPQASAPAMQTPPAVRKCSVRTAPLTPGERALAAHDLPKSEALFREEAKQPGDDGDRAHSNLIRVLLREERFDDASRDAGAWTSAAPSSTWAKVSFYEVQWRRGQVAEARDTILAASKMDLCNPRVYQDFASLYRFSGLKGTAKTVLDKARRLDPVDDGIAGDWMQLQPRSVKLDALTMYLQHADYLPPADRKALENWKIRLAAPPTGERCHLVGDVATTSIPFRAMQDGINAPTFWGLDVDFNGKSRRLEIDTGAHGLTLTKAAANALHLDVDERGTTGGIGDEGLVNSHRSRVKSIKIGALEFADCTVEILERTSSSMEAIDGLIGGDVFSDFLLTLDFPGRVLKLDPLPPQPNTPPVDKQAAALATGAAEDDRPVRDRYIDPSMKDWTKVFRSGHDLILPVMLNSSAARLFIVDTGSQLNLVSWQMAKQVGKVSKGSDVELQGISGKVKQTYTTGPIELYFAGLRQQSNGLVGMDTSALGRDTGVEIAGPLGAPVLRQLTVQIDYRDDLIHLSYDPKRLIRCVPGIRVADCF